MLTKAIVQEIYASIRTVVSGANVTIRHANKEYTGTRIPFEQGEMVDDDGAIFTVQGGVRLVTSELAPVWPKSGDKVQVKVGNNTAWSTFIVLPTRLDETEATMLMTYGERYDQEGL